MNAPPPLENNAISIRPMKSEDLPQVQMIDRLSFSMPWPGSAYEYELYENPLSLLWVAEAHTPEGEDKVVGMVVVWLIVDEAHIATIAVLPEYRGQGIARCLLVTALQAVIQRNFRIVTLEVRSGNLAAQNLYSRFGFAKVGFRPKYYRDNNEDALIMTVYNLDQAYLNWLEKNTWKSLSGVCE
jgi:[ribosomal protein S18]-alanine N-acetyltransferase